MAEWNDDGKDSGMLMVTQAADDKVCLNENGFGIASVIRVEYYSCE